MLTLWKREAQNGSFWERHETQIVSSLLGGKEIGGNLEGKTSLIRGGEKIKGKTKTS